MSIGIMLFRVNDCFSFECRSNSSAESTYLFVTSFVCDKVARFVASSLGLAWSLTLVRACVMLLLQFDLPNERS